MIRGLGRSMRMESQGHEQVEALYRQGRHIILAFWHAQQLMDPDQVIVEQGPTC